MKQKISEKNSDRYIFSIKITDTELDETITKINYNTNYLDEMQSTLRSIELKVIPEYNEKKSIEFLT